MKYIVKGNPMSGGGRVIPECNAFSGRFAVGLFGSSGLSDDSHHGIPAGHEERIPFPPRTLILLADNPA